MGVNAKVVADSYIKHLGLESRIITMEIELHRFILPEHNTHRSFSRNFQSSRAIPTKRQRELVLKDPAMPVFWGSDKPGMVAGSELEGTDKAEAKFLWLEALSYMADIHERMQKVGVHKQIANRLLEPFMYTKGVVTATAQAFNAFFKLRCAKDAQPEIQALANEMREAMGASWPVPLEPGDWHLPYVEDVNNYDTIQDALKTSVSCCAQVSYRKMDDTMEKANKIFGMLNLDGEAGNPHASPCEHQARAESFGGDPGNLCAPWTQYRKMLGI